MPGPRRIPDRFIQTGDRLQQEAQQLARDSAVQINQCPFLRGRMVSVLFTAAKPIVVTHKLGTVARCFPASLMYGPSALPQDPVDLSNLWLQRGWQGSPLAGFTLRAGSFTAGTRFSVAVAKTVSGVRFMWPGGATRTMRSSLWLDSTGVLLNSIDMSVSSAGIYESVFRVPTDLTQYLNVNLTIGVWDISATNYVASGVDTIGGLQPYVFPEGTSLQHKRLFAAGNARPATAAATEDYWLEPAYLTKGVSITEHPDQSGIDPKSQIRLIADANGYADMWFYPSASVGVPTGLAQSP